jgi:hypothetical protein
VSKRLRIDIREGDDGLYFEYFFLDAPVPTAAFPRFLAPRQPESEKDLAKVQALLISGFNGNEGWHANLRAWGLNAFALHLPLELQTVFRTEESLTLTWLLCSSKAAAFPWELMHDGTDFICRRHAMGRLLQQSSAPAHAKPNASGGIIIFADLNNDLPAARREGEAITELFESQTAMKTLGSGRLTYPSLLCDAGRDIVLEELQKAQVVHFCSHSKCSNGRQDSGWILRGGQVLPLDDIQDLGMGLHVPALVFSNSCGSSEVGSMPDPISGIAGAFLSSGVGGFIGTICNIGDDASLEFPMLFYPSLTGDKALAAAVLEARKNTDASNPIWAAYRFYGDPKFRLPNLLLPMENEVKSVTSQVDGSDQGRLSSQSKLFKHLLFSLVLSGIFIAVLFGMARVFWKSDSSNQKIQNFLYEEGNNSPSWLRPRNATHP